MGHLSRFNLLLKLINDNDEEIQEDISSSSYVYSLSCIKSKIKQIEMLRDGIFQTQNLYVTQILFRSLIEHYLVAFYVFLKFRIEKSDNVGVEFYDFYANSEFFKQESYSILIDNIKSNANKNSQLETLKSIYPGLSELSQNDFESYHKEANKFADIKKIASFIVQNENFEPKLNKVGTETIKLLHQYNYLSSFVHGGPYAERTFMETTVEEQKKLMKNVIDWANTLGSLSICFFLLSMTSVNSDKYNKLLNYSYKS